MDKVNRWSGVVFALVLLGFSGLVRAEDGQGAFVTRSSDGVTVSLAGAPAVALPSLSRLAPESRVVVAAGAQFQVVYLAGGRQESWSGPVELITGLEQSAVIGAPTEPKVKLLPPFLVETLTKSPGVITDIQSRQGMIRLRSLMTAKKVKAIEARYTEMRQQFGEDDITPELYLLTALDEIKVYHRMRAPLEEMIRRQPNNAEARALYNQFIEILNGEGKGGQTK
jgi:hypothetical protein